jgi:hypothetical protein
MLKIATVQESKAESLSENHPPFMPPTDSLYHRPRSYSPASSFPIMNSSINDVFDQGESLGTFLASLTTSGAILGLGIMVYILLKWKCPGY